MRFSWSMRWLVGFVAFVALLGVIRLKPSARTGRPTLTVGFLPVT